MPTRDDKAGKAATTTKKPAAQSAATKPAPAKKEGAPDKKATTPAAASTAPATTAKSALFKKFEDLLGKLKLKPKSLEEKQITNQGQKLQVVFADFGKGEFVSAAKDMLYNFATTDDAKGYSLEVEDQEEVLMFYKG